MALTKIPGNLIETGAITAAALDNDAVTTAKILDANITHAKLHTSMDLTGKTVTVATAAGSTNTTAAASTAFVQQELTTLIGGAPGTLDTLNELAAAINDDSNYNSTLTTALATKLPLAGGTMTGQLVVDTDTEHQIKIDASSSSGASMHLNTAGGYAYTVYQNSNRIWRIGAYGGSSFTIRDHTGGTDPLVIDSSGNVGIGETSPSAKLHVKKTAASTQHYDLYATAIIEDTEGRLQIIATDGGSNASALLLSNEEKHWGVVNHGPSQNNTFGIGYYASSSTGGDFADSLSSPFTITTSGNVGIGTNSPIEKLDVNGYRGIAVNNNYAHMGSTVSGGMAIFGHNIKSDSANNTIKSANTGYHSSMIKMYYDEGITFHATTGTNTAGDVFYNISGTTNELMRITNAGNVGIGDISPAELLTVKDGNIKLKSNNDGNKGILMLYDAAGTQSGQVYPSAGDLRIWSPNDVLILPTGNVGIGTNNPNLPLTVTSNAGANALAIRARSADDYGFMQFYNHAGDTVRGQVYSHSTGNAVGISTGNSSNNGIRIDNDGLHFQKTDGQKISAKESIVMQVDADNNTASRVFQVIHGNGNTLLNLHDDYRTEVGTLQYSSTRSAGAGATGSFSASAGDWVDVAAIPYGRNVATIKFFWDGLSAPGSAHHGLMEFDIASHYGTSYYYGWDSSINLKNSTAHNSFYITEARIITPNGSGATGYFQVKFAVAVSTGTFRSYVTARDEQCSIDPVNPAVNNSRSGTTIAELKLGTDQGLVRNRVGMATSRDMHIGGGLTVKGQTSFNAYSPAVTTTNSTVVFGNTRHNIGSGYSTSTGRFTASTAGKYFFTFDVLMDSSANANYGRVLFRVNNVSGTMEQYGDSLTYQATGQSYFGLGLTCLISLNVGDYVEVYNSGQWATYGTQYGVFCGHLLG
jgi:hypothetical protein